MIIYRLERNIDGYGGRLKDEYFTSYESAKLHLISYGPVFHNDSDWVICGMKDCEICEGNNSLQLRGVRKYDD